MLTKVLEMQRWLECERLREHVQADHPGYDIYLKRYTIEVRDPVTGEIVEEYDYEER